MGCSRLASQQIQHTALPNTSNAQDPGEQAGIQLLINKSHFHVSIFDLDPGWSDLDFDMQHPQVSCEHLHANAVPDNLNQKSTRYHTAWV